MRSSRGCLSTTVCGLTMYSLFISLLWVVGHCSHVYEEEVSCHPEQVHIAFGDSLTEMTIMWSTEKNCTSEISYGTDPWHFGQKETGEMKHFTLLNSRGLQCLHRVKLKGLKPDTTYFYRPISNNISSGPFYFHTPTQDTDFAHEFLVYGDLGAQSDSIPRLDTEALSGRYSAVLHIGDFAYNMRDDGGQSTKVAPSAKTNVVSPANITSANETSTSITNDTCFTEVGDVFMRLIEGISSRLPYMTSVGNHEIDDDTFAHYRHRFSMPNTPWPTPVNQMWYSWNIGLVHFISYSSEVFFSPENGENIPKQREWLLRDLQMANKNRNQQPWIIAYGHRPMYCSNADGDDCTSPASKVRIGLEDIFYDNGVDLVLQAHEHSYERLWPQYKGVVLSKNYSNPQAPVQLISGAAGSKHFIDKMADKVEDWSAFRSALPAFDSFGRLKIYNATHLYWEQIAVNTSKMIDNIWLVQNSHGPFKGEKLTKEVTNKIEEHKEETNKIIAATNQGHSKPEAETPESNKVGSVNYLADKKTKIVVGVSAGVLVIIIILTIALICRIRQRKPRKYRRWEQTVDYGRKFYSSYEHVGNNEKDTDDFEVDVTDGNLPTSKLLNDGDR